MMLTPGMVRLVIVSGTMLKPIPAATNPGMLISEGTYMMFSGRS